jgi:hypothetical protein
LLTGGPPAAHRAPWQCNREQHNEDGRGHARHSRHLQLQFPRPVRPADQRLRPPPDPLRTPSTPAEPSACPVTLRPGLGLPGAMAAPLAHSPAAPPRHRCPCTAPVGRLSSARWTRSAAMLRGQSRASQWAGHYGPGIILQRKQRSIPARLGVNDETPVSLLTTSPHFLAGAKIHATGRRVRGRRMPIAQRRR